MGTNDELNRGSIKGKRVVRIVVPVVAVLLSALGLGLMFSAGQQESFGWFAYAPLTDAAFLSGDLVFLPGSARIGIALTGVGLLVLAFWSGFRTASQRR
ncbi:hypothetical protein IV498_03575 [Paenarthrobacter sp. Z7-10]|uniref:hypothetical protein n=1 Tax=Paenarthrobacter sp. Z7-10 TaxID=2787635 RepID=UPI0022A9F308|nr:hypothetical protein [Paenarthrobacter sp. Z7-10]MCZ2402281.1 hypothetical protein [Paenarthrobacter sp. Z7-10]